MTPRARLVVLVATAVVTAGCATSHARTATSAHSAAALATPSPTASASTAPTTGSGATASGSASPPATGQPASTGPSSAAPPVPAGDRCHTSQLRGALIDSQGAAGNVYVDFTLTDTAAVDCSVAGYVGVQLLDGSGQPLPTTLGREGQPVNRVQLHPGQSAYFYLHFPNPSVLDPPCQPPSAARLLVTPPDERDAITVPATAAGGGSPVRPCHGQLSTAPVSATHGPG